MSSAYQAIEQKAEELNIIEAYHDDLYFHDFNTLHGENPPDKFLWQINDCGTHLYPVNEVDSSLISLLQKKDEKYALFFWNGADLLDLKDLTACQISAKIRESTK